MHARSYWLAGLAAFVAMPSHGARPRLLLDLRGLDSSGVSYHPGRWPGGASTQSATSSSGMAKGPVVKVTQPPAYAPRPDGFGTMADLHPLGNGFRLSFGVREEQRGRPLRGAGNVADVATNSFAPVATVGYVGLIGRKLAIGIDAGLTMRNARGLVETMVVTPFDKGQPGARGGYAPIADVSLIYRF